MKRKTLSVLISVLAVLLWTQSVFAGSASTKYPIVLAHGMGFTAENLGVVDYWWGIDNELTANGAVVYKTAVNGMDGTRAKALSFKEQVKDILAETGAEKVNIIGHSHGTIYTRDAISNLGLAKYVASHTSIAGPHQGSTLANLILKGVPDFLEDKIAGVMDFLYTWVLGDSNPDSLQNALDITTYYMKDVFNPNTPNKSGIYYQSWAAKVKWSSPNIVLQPTWLIMLMYEGSNDGLVGVESAKWGNFRGVEDGAWYCSGLDHASIIDQFFGITPGFDAPDFYVDIASDLKRRGY